MNIVWIEPGFEMGYMKREEIAKRGFRDTGFRYARREVFEKNGERIYYDPSDGWFSRVWDVDERQGKKQLQHKP